MLVRARDRSHRVRFAPLFQGLERGLADGDHLLVDSKVARLYAGPLRRALASRSVVLIEADERSKSLEALPRFVRRLVADGLRRDHRLTAVGGGVTLEIAAFLAGTLLRGLRWRCYPTTLLAQADSCIGGKSSLNAAGFKNQLGTITPPEEVVVCPDALATLPPRELRSGLGEVIKAHVVSGWGDVRALARDMPRLPADRGRLLKAVRRSLEVKKRLVEADEFDRGARLLLNYGHTFGHALESASGWRLPHGIAVTVGMDMANRLSEGLGLLSHAAAEELGALLDENLRGLKLPAVRPEPFLDALGRDKKRTGEGPRLVLLRGPGRLLVRRLRADRTLGDFCRDYLRSPRYTRGTRRSP